MVNNINTDQTNTNTQSSNNVTNTEPDDVILQIYEKYGTGLNIADISQGDGLSNLSFETSGDSFGEGAVFQQATGGTARGLYIIEETIGDSSTDSGEDTDTISTDGDLDTTTTNTDGSSTDEDTNTTTTDETPGPVVQPNANGSVAGDPHFKGFNGSYFDEQGISGETYDLLSDKGIQINAEFQSWGGSTATIIGEVGVMIDKDKLTINPMGQLPSLNGTELEVGQTVPIGNSGATITTSSDGRLATLQTKEYEITFTSNPGYIDVSVDTSADGVFTDWTMPRGLLGQTADPAIGTTETAGTAADYVVSDLFATDDKFNQFQG